jgi:hypothetical protein
MTDTYDFLKAQKDAIHAKQVDEQLLHRLDELIKHSFNPSNIYRYYYPSATGDWVNVRELRAVLGVKHD